MNTLRHGFDATERTAVYRAIRERRDMRHFLPLPVEPVMLRRLLEAAHAAPSVGLTQPWRFIRITQSELREQIHAVVERERQATAATLGGRSAEFMRLKVQGIRECGELLVVAVRDGGREEVFGRRLMPEMDLASAACAIQNLWLAARAEGIGVGWVSMFDPERLGSLLHLPADTRPVALLCIGHVEAFYPAPMLSMERWRQPRPLDDLLGENAWPESVAVMNTHRTGLQRIVCLAEETTETPYLPGEQDRILHQIKSCDILQPGPAALTDGLRQLQTLIAAAAHIG